MFPSYFSSVYKDINNKDLMIFIYLCIPSVKKDVTYTDQDS